MMNQDRPQHLTTSELQELNAKFYSFHPVDEGGVSGFFSQIGKKIKRGVNSLEFETVKEQLASKLTEYKTLEDSIREPLRKSKPVSENLIDKALRAIDQQHRTLETCVSLAKSRSNSSQLSKTLSSISNIQFLRQISAEISKDELDTGAKNIVGKRINYLSLPKKEEVKQRSQKLFHELATETAAIHSPANYLDGSQIIGGLRFTSIKPPKASAVQLSALKRKKPNTLHANYVGDCYIATQSPQTEAKNPDSIPAFYQMVLENDSNTIVNLTNANDSKQSPDLRVKYWPNSGKSVNYKLNGSLITVRTQHIDNKDGFDIITLELTRDSDKHTRAQLIKLFHFAGWPPSGAPHGRQAESFRTMMQALTRHQQRGRTIVHCRAGVGRTAALIVIEQLREKIRAGEINSDNFVEKTKALIARGREERGQKFVQSADQLQFILEQVMNEVPQK